MKTLLTLSFLCIFCFVITDDKTKNTAFEQTRELIGSNRFRVEAERAYPAQGKTVDLFSNKGYIILSDTLAKGFLPFFGRAYSLPYGDDGGIEFNSTVRNRKITLNKNKRNRNITYRFSVRAQNDVYTIILLIQSNRNCNITVQSNQRSSISYSGKIYPLPEKKLQP